jgi:hypothetical protein
MDARVEVRLVDFYGAEGAFFDFGEFVRVVVGGGVVVVGDGVICGVDVPRACVLRCRTFVQSSERAEISANSGVAIAVQELPILTATW